MAAWQFGVTIETMTGSPPGVGPGGSWPPPPGPPPAWPPTAPKQSRAPAVISLVIAVIALGLAIGSWFRPPVANTPPQTEGTPQFSENEIDRAVTAVCDSYRKVREAITAAGGQTSEDPNVRFIIAVNARLAIHSNSSYLRQSLADNPALPPESARIFRDMAAAYDEILMGQLAGAPSDSFKEVNAKLDGTDVEAVEACK
jgi:hypothetical protein